MALVADLVQTGTIFDEADISALFVPFGGTGAAPTSTTIESARRRTPGRSRGVSGLARDGGEAGRQRGAEQADRHGGRDEGRVRLGVGGGALGVRQDDEPGQRPETGGHQRGRRHGVAQAQCRAAARALGEARARGLQGGQPEERVARGDQVAAQHVRGVVPGKGEHRVADGDGEGRTHRGDVGPQARADDQHRAERERHRPGRVPAREGHRVDLLVQAERVGEARLGQQVLEPLRGHVRRGEDERHQQGHAAAGRAGSRSL